ncbi:hypothetical protein P175DRAFT_0435638 [Aspergillus ochraceoroseus IBT 24754]|uniref:Uncharacterized protein n=1 Tax=Aspergillus ochraceoroseus IBT 24754 TaxID=1392256 RepID=A0A2T5M0C3_9EURO|nr:uncharacterized protein P175DRAFT_0435638 [Aspergillus ochraceoroseus IBT 24754]PTU21982.1 hypothetical protein P175DRAFT_0435638 [Aspergillus ochraceoroseus IBT 24754]
MTAPLSDDRHPRESHRRVTPPSVSSSSPWDRPPRISDPEGLPESTGTAAVAADDADSIAADGPRPLSCLASNLDPKALTSRSGNRDRVPPPPPKSHHGKLISLNSSRGLPTSQTTPGRVVNRASYYHASSSSSSSSPGPSLARQGSHSSLEDFSCLATSQAVVVPSTDALRRSQSQYKRPPTPPLSRRHSQMRRSKSTLAKPISSQLAAPPVQAEATVSTPPSPRLRPLTPSRSRESRLDATFPEESSSTSTVRSEIATPSIPSTEGSPSLASPRLVSKRASLANNNPLPPPPPPRRTRGTSNHSNESTRPASIRSEQRADGVENFVPHPSNAKDILADLSRLQKEVDDLRGHYENRKAN